MRAQALMKYLLTYGLIIAILIVGAVVFYYGFYAQGAPKSGCTGILKITADDWKYDESGRFSFSVENRAGQIINVTSVKASTDDVTVSKNTNLFIREDEKSGKISIQMPPGNVSDYKEINLKIKYLMPGQITGENTFNCDLIGEIE